jgi:hypothetical protein
VGILSGLELLLDFYPSLLELPWVPSTAKCKFASSLSSCLFFPSLRCTAIEDRKVEEAMASYNAGSAAEFGNAHSNDSALDVIEKSDPTQLEAKEQERLDAIAARGHAATDQYGMSYTQEDSKRKRTKQGFFLRKCTRDFRPQGRSKTATQD